MTRPRVHMEWLFNYFIVYIKLTEHKTNLAFMKKCVPETEKNQILLENNF